MMEFTIYTKNEWQYEIPKTNDGVSFLLNVKFCTSTSDNIMLLQTDLTSRDEELVACLQHSTAPVDGHRQLAMHNSEDLKQQ